MKLEVHERLLLLSLLPKEGDYAALKTIRRARESLSFSPTEQKELEMKNDITADGKPQVTWNSTKAAESVKDVPVDEYTTNVIRDALAELNKKKKLEDKHMSVYEKFIITYK